MMGEQPQTMAKRALRCRVLSNRSEIRDIEDRWSSLCADSQSGGPFQSPAWCATWWDHFGNASNTPIVVTCEEGADLVGVAPLYRNTERGVRFLQIVGDAESADISWLIRSGVDCEDVVAAMLVALYGSPVPWDAVKLFHIQSGPLRDALLAVARRCKFVPLRRTMGHSKYLDVSKGAEAAGSGVSSKLKNTIKKRRRKAAKMGELKFSTQASISDAEFEMILDVEKKSWKSEAGFRLNTKQDFFREVFRRLGESGQLRYSRLQLNDELVTYLISLLSSDGRVLAYETAYDRSYADISPGTLVHFEEILSLSAGPERELDFLGGGEVYKSEWTNTERPVHELVLARRSLRGILYAWPYVVLKWRAKNVGWFEYACPSNVLGGAVSVLLIDDQRDGSLKLTLDTTRS